MRSCTHAGGGSFGFDRRSLPLNEIVSRVAGRLWPVKTARNLAARAGTTHRAAEAWLAGHLRDMQKPWPALSESEQSGRVFAASAAARSLVAKAVKIVAGKGFASVAVSVGKFAVKDGQIKAEFTCSATHNYLLAIADLQGSRAVLVLSDPETFNCQRDEPAIDKDQPDLIGPDDDKTEDA